MAVEGRQRSATRWRELVEAWKRSGKSAAIFASERKLNAKSLTWWAWQLKRREVASGGGGLEGAQAGGEMFLPLRVVDEPELAKSAAEASSSSVELVLGAGRVLRVPVGTDASWLAQMVHALEGGRGC